jgi:hypothetical protein
MLASISVRTRVTVPVVDFLANSLRRNRRSTELGDSVNSEGVSRASREARFGAEAMSQAAGLGVSRTSPIRWSVEAEGLQAQGQQFLNNVQAA